MSAMLPSTRALRILILERDGLIGFLLTEALSKAGHAVIGPFSNEEHALAALSVDRPDVAVLDPFLSDNGLVALARQVMQHGIPFLFITSADPAEIPAEFSDRPVLTKPFSIADLFMKLDGLRAPEVPRLF